MTVLTSIPNGASRADIRATLNDFFNRLQTREGGTMPVLTQILNGSSLADVRATFNSALTRLSTLEAATGSGTPTPTPTLTLTGFYLNGSTNPILKAGLARVTGGTGHMRMLCIGDSTTDGCGGDGANLYANSWINSYPHQLAAQYTSAGILAISTARMGDGNIAPAAAQLPAADPRVSFTGAATSYTAANLPTLGGGSFYNDSSVNGGAGTMTLVVAETCDRFDVFSLNVSGNGTVSVAVDGGAATTINTASGPSGYTKTTVSCPRGTNHSVVITWPAGPSSFIAGLAGYDSTAAQIEIFNAGYSSGRAQDIAKASSAFDAMHGMAVVAADLTIIPIAINDWLNGTDQTTFQTNLQTLITAAKVTGDVLLMVPWPSKAAAVPLATQAQYQGYIKALGVSNNVTVLDLIENIGVAPVSEMFDNLHPNHSGYAHKDTLIRTAIQAMAS